MTDEEKMAWGRKEFEQRLADIEAVKAGAMSMAAAQKAARSRSRKSGMPEGEAFRSMRESHHR